MSDGFWKSGLPEVELCRERLAFPECFMGGGGLWRFDQRKMDAWWAEQRMLAAMTGLLLVSGSYQQAIKQQHENARARRVIRRWAWKHCQ